MRVVRRARLGVQEEKADDRLCWLVCSSLPPVAAELIQEAIVSFKLSTRIFSMLQPPPPSTEIKDGLVAGATTTTHRRPTAAAHSPPTLDPPSTKESPTPAQLRALSRQTNPLENPPLSSNAEWYLKIGMAVFVLVAYKVMSWAMLEEGEGLDRTGSRLARFLGRE